jgi:peptidyl-prolyl cis-trans isomerase B (cyclophilin B)
MSFPPPHEQPPAYGPAQLSVPAQPYPGYANPPYAYPPRPTNAMAIASLVCAFLFAPLGIVFGHLSLSQIRRSGEDGRGLAIAGLVIGYVVTIATVVAVVAGTLLFAWAARVVRESTDPGGAGIPRYHAWAPYTAETSGGAGHPVNVVHAFDVAHRVQHMA